jgi:predicted RNase H-like nuclease
MTLQAVGVDGYRDEWVAIALRDGHFESAFLAKRISLVVDRFQNAAAIAVDIPIGSEPDRFRRVDLAARTFVGPRSNSVFRVPPLHLFHADNFETACSRCRELTNNGFSKQAWELRGKIAEVADVARRDSRIIEVHPEVSFRELVGCPLAYGKKTWAGQQLRRAALEKAGIILPDDLGPVGTASPDDVLDAAVAAWSANRHGRGESKYFEPKLLDAGRPVTIWF